MAPTTKIAPFAFRPNALALAVYVATIGVLPAAATEVDLTNTNAADQTAPSNASETDAPDAPNALEGADAKPFEDNSSNALPNAAPTKNNTPISEDEQAMRRLAAFYRPSDAQCQGVWRFPALATPQSEGSVYVAADRAYYDARARAELFGDVIVDQNGRQVRTQSLFFDPTTGDATTNDEAIFGETRQSGDLMGIAQSLHYNTQTGNAKAKNIAFASQSVQAHGYAAALDRQTQTRYRLQNATFSACPPTERVWRLEAKSIDLDRETGRGVAKHATLKLKNTPVFYLPYFDFPIDDRRASGFLVPTFGLDSGDGVQISLPYYLNLAPQYDATLTPTLYSGNNPRLAGEFRYLTRFGEGAIDGAWLANDKNYDRQNRYHVFFDHKWQPFANKPLRLLATYRYVSDNDYLSDFDNLGLSNNPLNLPRRLQANYQSENLNATLRAETYQRLEGLDAQGDRILDKDRPYARLPQFILNARLPTPKDSRWQFGLQSNSGYFKRSIQDQSDNEKSGVRLYNSLYADYLWAKPWGYIAPKARFSHLYVAYDEDSLAGQNLSKEDGSFHVIAPSFSVDTQLRFEKRGSPFGAGDAQGVQLLSPRLKYTYAPYKDQSRLPNFETSWASISYDQLFEDSWFLGRDRLSDLHALSLGLNYRYLDRYGNTRLDASVGEQFFLQDMKVGLGEDDLALRKRSGVAWQSSLQAIDNVWLDASGSFNRDYRPSSFIAFLRYQPYANMLFSAGVIERKKDDALGQMPLSAYTASAIFPLNNRWKIATTAQYDNTYNQFMETLVGVGYQDCCIGIALYGRHYRNDLDPTAKSNKAVMIEVRFNGLSKEGGLSRAIGERVMGYSPSVWQSAW